MTKKEKRLFIREVAKCQWCGDGDFTIKEVILRAQGLAEELEAFERKQDEEEAMKQECFGGCMGFHTKKNDCTKCIVSKQCQEKRGAK